MDATRSLWVGITPLGGPVVPLEHGASYARPQRTEQQASNAAGDRRLSLTLAKEEARGCQSEITAEEWRAIGSCSHSKDTKSHAHCFDR